MNLFFSLIVIFNIQPKRSVDRNKELGQSIGLLTLSKVLENVNDKQYKGFIPYRESKLTHVII